MNFKNNTLPLGRKGEYFCWLMTKDICKRGRGGGGGNPVLAPIVTQKIEFCEQSWHKRAEISRFYTEMFSMKIHQIHTIKYYTKQWGVVKTLVRAARKLHFSVRIENCSNTKQLFSVSSRLLGKSKTIPPPSDIARSALPDRFCMFFSQKIHNIRQDLDAHPSEPATFSAYDGPKLCLFQPVTEEEIRKLIVESPTKTCMLDPIPISLTKERLSALLPLWNHPTSVQAGRSNPTVKET